MNRRIFVDMDGTLAEWKENESETNGYVLYAMLKKNFEFPTKFTVLDNGEFGNYKNVKFFGINSKTDNVTRKQVEVLYYNSAEDFAIKLITKGNDEIIITKGNIEDSFLNIYQDAYSLQKIKALALKNEPLS